MDRPRPRLFGVVLAGGRSRRYGSPKARARLAGVTLLEHALAILRAAGLETGVIANRADDLPA
ncbi:MAG: NTP transferase domain-containing protein, partial [Gammaproteobacteria bacterium]|nr:NTP transferase domain-containing protein [Gammaproteobacteria bacterium]